VVLNCRVQKLFSAFPGGWPGLGLLLLRALVGVTLIAQIVAYVGSTKLSVLGWVVAALVLIIASCLLVGFMTPVAAIVIGLGAIALAASNVLDTNQTLLNMIVLTTAIALLGPGAFSIDARMFGRREILIPNTPRYSK
jgi:uncharacterized membrane protein YphA (DoxX/SURF4 family)